MDEKFKKNSDFKPIKQVNKLSIVSINKFDELLSKEFLENYFKQKK